MKLQDIQDSTLRALLARDGVFFHVGPFVVSARSGVREIADLLPRLYGDFRVAATAEFADFHVAAGSGSLAHKWFRRQVQIYFDGEPLSGRLPVEQAFASFDGSINWCIYTHAHQYLIVHAAAVERNGFAAILPAPPGSGKSTLCAALVQRGWRLLSDELTLIDPSSGHITALAKPISLKNRSIEIMRAFAPGVVIDAECKETHKGRIALMRPPSDSVARVGETANPRWIVVPKYAAGEALTVTALPKAWGFMHISNSSVNYPFLGRAGFALLSQIVDHSGCYRLNYSEFDDAIAWFDERAEDASSR